MLLSDGSDPWRRVGQPDVLTTTKAWDVLQGISMVYGVAVDLFDFWSSLSSKCGELSR